MSLKDGKGFSFGEQEEELEGIEEMINIDITPIEPQELVNKYINLISRIESMQELTAYLNEFYTEVYKNSVIEDISEKLQFLAKISAK